MDGKMKKKNDYFLFKSKIFFYLIISGLAFIIVSYLSFIIIDHLLNLDISSLIHLLILIMILVLIMVLFVYFLVIKRKWEHDIDQFLQDVFCNNKFIYPLLGLKIADFTTNKMKQDIKQLNHYFSKLTYVIMIYFIVVFSAFFIYFLAFIINIGFNQPFNSALLSVSCTTLPLLVGTYVAQLYQRWKNKVSDFKKQYDLIYKRIMMFRRFLYFTDLNKINFNDNETFIKYHFFPNYLLKWLYEGNYKHNKAVLINELLIWKKYLTNLEYLNHLSWVKCLHLLINDQFKISEETKAVILNSVTKIDNEVNIFLQEQRCTNYSLVKNPIIKQNYHFLWIKICQKNNCLNQIKNILKILSFNSMEKNLKQNPLLEEQLNLNIFQLDYLKVLFTITFF